ncbi:hypothetical protein KsCSTR_10270 [Candidatus Kuenenia stuttgartiensis]|uniref:Uncharacterized protein n=1 Tax=Kuenenia stuttgartiensis TaxID=174633 RepID=Q1PYR2_KUEST|nr:hypothetical protein KsCSTR_10270 [Candidatus Kuenenia stuttgartiensis]CAJ72231.1 unknown protein [Candidatus Kuenenia stuttgartiensis]
MGKMKHRKIFLNIIGSIFHSFFPGEAGASQTIAFPSRSLGTRVLFEMLNESIFRISCLFSSGYASLG